MTVDSIDAVQVLERLAHLVQQGVPSDQPLHGAAQLVQDLRDMAAVVRGDARLSAEQVGNANTMAGREWDVALARCLYGHQVASTIL